MNGDLDILNEGWLRIESMKATQINKKKPWCILTPEFKSPPNPTEKQVYLRKFAERMQSHIYKGQTMHWGKGLFKYLAITLGGGGVQREPKYDHSYLIAQYFLGEWGSSRGQNMMA